MKLLILGGGGTLGAFSAGALEVLHASGWRPDAFIGSSAGAINLLRYLVGGPEAAVSFWRDIGVKTLVGHMLMHAFWKNGLLDPKRFRARVDDGVDYARMHDDPRVLAFIVVDLETGKVAVRGNRTEPTPEALRAVAHGAYALPPLLPPVRWGNEVLSDGGLLYNAPLTAAIDLGATEIVYLCNVQVLPHREWFTRPSTWRNAARYAEVFFRRASNVGFADAEIVDDRFRGIPFLVIAPPPNLRLGAITRWMLPTVNAMEHLIGVGRQSAERAVARWGWLRGDHRVQIEAEAL